MKAYKVGILGASGAVGQEMMKILNERNFPIEELHLFASARSAGKVVSFRGKDIVVEEAKDEAFQGLDIVLGAATVIKAMGEGRAAARACNARLQSSSPKPESGT